jgi:hypothetical protein
MKRSVLAFIACCATVLAPFTACIAQDTEAIGIKCTQSKLKAAGKACACAHKSWASAIATGELPDFSACDGKLTAAFAKAEEKAVAAGGQCLAGEPASAVVDAIAAAADKTVSQSGRGVITPAPDACDGLSKTVSYAGGSYEKMPKCVKRNPADTTCDGFDTRGDLADAIEKDFKCPTCPDGEKGCEPGSFISLGDTEERGGKCCLKAGLNGASETLTISCGVCVSEP